MAQGYTDNFDNLYVSEFLNRPHQKFAYPAKNLKPQKNPPLTLTVSPTVEGSAPNSGDANNDGGSRYTLANVASYVNPVTNNYVVLPNI